MNMTTRCQRCGRSYHKTERGPNIPYTPGEEHMIETLAARGYTASVIADIINSTPRPRARSTQNIREKARCMGVKLQPGKPGNPRYRNTART
jgi:hypothetical protein